METGKSGLRHSLETLLSGGETARLECKSANGGFPKSFWETYSAFANMDGGTIVLGVSETRDGKFDVHGVERPESLVKTLWDTVNNPDKVSANVLFDRHVRIEKAGAKSVVVVEVPRADRQDRPVFVGRDVFRGTYRRNGEGDYRCSKEAVLAMLRDQGADTVDGTMVESLAVSDLDEGTIRRYRGRFAQFKQGHVWNDLPDEEFLLKIGAAKRDANGIVRPNRAGLLCFGNFVSIADEFPYFFLDYRERLSGETRWSDRVCSGDATWSGNVYDFFFRIHDRLTADIRVPFAMSDAVSRIDDTDVHKAVREALVNALVHADYFGRQGIVVEKEFRRISISNPGVFRISRDVAISGGTSDARNARLFNIFSLVDVGERSGSGLCNIFHVWRATGNPTPTVFETFDPERIEFVLEMKPETVGESKEKTAQSKEKSKEKTAQSKEKSKEKTAQSKEKILGILADNPFVTIAEMVSSTGLSVSGVEKGLRELKSTGRIRRVGPDKGGRWEVIKASAP